MNERCRQLLSRLSVQLRADHKKTAVLAGLFLVLAGLVAKRLGSGSNTPEVAVASAPKLAAVTAPQAEPSLRPVPQTAAPTPVPAPVATLTPPPSGPAPRGADEPARRVPVAGLSRKLHRDPFSSAGWDRLGPALLSRWGGTSDEAAAKGSSLWSTIATALIEHRRLRRHEVESLRKELAGLTLQSTLTGSRPLAYISGQLVREGQMLRGFSVLRIRDRRVLLRRDGYELELSMP